MPIHDEDAIRAIFDRDPFAVIGCSSTPGKAAHEVPRYLIEHGYEIIPINPTVSEIFERPAYDSLGEVEEPIAVVTVFRPSEEVAGIVDSILERNDVECLWLQLGIRDADAITRAEKSGISVVEDRCMKIEHDRLFD